MHPPNNLNVINFRPMSIFRLLMSLVVLHCCGCQPSPVAPSVSAIGGIDESWLHLTHENWDYKTLTPWLIKEYHFNGGGIVTCQFAPNQYSDVISEGTLFYHVESNGNLAITNTVNGSARWVFQLISLSATTAEVAELTTGTRLQFSRRFIDRRS